MSTFNNQPPGWAVTAAQEELSTTMDEPTWDAIAARAWELVKSEEPLEDPEQPAH